MSTIRLLLTGAAAALGLFTLAPASEAKSSKPADGIVTETGYRATDGMIPKPKVRHARNAHKHRHYKRYARGCGIFEPHPNGYCPNYTGPIYHRVGISYAGVENYAEVPEGYRIPYMLPRYHRVGYSYGWPPYNDGRRLHPYHHHMWY